MLIKSDNEELHFKCNLHITINYNTITIPIWVDALWAT